MDASARQNRFYALDNTETATPGYALLGLGAGTTYTNRAGRPVAQLFLQVDNVFDTAYQAHLNRLKYFEYYAGRAQRPLGHLQPRPQHEREGGGAVLEGHGRKQEQYRCTGHQAFGPVRYVIKHAQILRVRTRPHETPFLDAVAAARLCGGAGAPTSPRPTTRPISAGASPCRATACASCSPTAPA